MADGTVECQLRIDRSLDGSRSRLDGYFTAVGRSVGRSRSPSTLRPRPSPVNGLNTIGPSQTAAHAHAANDQTNETMGRKIRPQSL